MQCRMPSQWVESREEFLRRIIRDIIQNLRSRLPAARHESSRLMEEICNMREDGLKSSQMTAKGLALILLLGNEPLGNS